VITSVLGQDLVDRLVVSVAPTVIGSGREAVGDLGVDRINEGLHLRDRRVQRVGQDILIAGDVSRAPGEWPEAATR
jgi:riboflavin biosynthesis pyrimidine reductase